MRGASFIWAPLDTVMAVDASTVEMTLDLRGADGPRRVVAVRRLDRQPRRRWRAVAADDTTTSSLGVDGGTGPYTIESYTPDSEVLLKAYPGYWGGWKDTNHYDKIVNPIIASDVDQQQALDGGTVDMAFSIPLENVQNYADNPDFTVIEQPSFFNYVGLFNTQPSAVRRSARPPGAVLRDPLRRHHHGRRAGLRHAVARPGAGGRLPVRQHGPPVHLRHRQGQERC